MRVREPVSGQASRTLAAAGATAFLGVWCLLSYGGIVPAVILPSPSEVLRAIPYLHFQEALVRSALASFYRVIMGFLLAAAVAILGPDNARARGPGRAVHEGRASGPGGPALGPTAGQGRIVLGALSRVQSPAASADVTVRWPGLPVAGGRGVHARRIAGPAADRRIHP